MRKHSPHHDRGLVVAWTPKADEQPDCETGNLLVVIHEEARGKWWRGVVAKAHYCSVPSPKMFAELSWPIGYSPGQMLGEFW